LDLRVLPQEPSTPVLRSGTQWKDYAVEELQLVKLEAKEAGAYYGAFRRVHVLANGKCFFYASRALQLYHQSRATSSDTEARVPNARREEFVSGWEACRSEILDFIRQHWDTVIDELGMTCGSYAIAATDVDGVSSADEYVQAFMHPKDPLYAGLLEAYAFAKIFDVPVVVYTIDGRIRNSVYTVSGVHAFNSNPSAATMQDAYEFALIVRKNQALNHFEGLIRAVHV
jgi:hypothetical protein